MNIDNTTIHDLSIFNRDEEQAIFNRLDFTQTAGGRRQLAKMFADPFKDINAINETQQILKCILIKEAQWPALISNGTIMVIEKYFESGIDTIPGSSNLFNAYWYKIIHNPDFSLTRYSVTHFIDFVKGFKQLIALFDAEDTPPKLLQTIRQAAKLLAHPVIEKMSQLPSGVKLSTVQTIYYGRYVRYQFKHLTYELTHIFEKLDAWFSMALAVKKFNLSFPEFVESDKAFCSAKDLYHLLLPTPVAYNIELDESHNFLFLTGANMAGKSTFIKAIGSAVYMAHLGMGVPAVAMRLSLFDGILSNITVTDNIVKGESYFFSEVLRIKNTIEKINDGRKWLVLIDELFKGTNVQDAMKCSAAVIKGLIRIPNSLFILSTHLYEIGDELKQYPSILFRYFETNVKDDQLEFSYQLKDGISNDRLGYLILKREKVVELLESL